MSRSKQQAGFQLRDFSSMHNFSSTHIALTLSEVISFIDEQCRIAYYACDQYNSTITDLTKVLTDSYGADVFENSYISSDSYLALPDSEKEELLSKLADINFEKTLFTAKNSEIQLLNHLLAIIKTPQESRYEDADTSVLLEILLLCANKREHLIKIVKMYFDIERVSDSQAIVELYKMSDKADLVKMHKSELEAWETCMKTVNNLILTMQKGGSSRRNIPRIKKSPVAMKQRRIPKAMAMAMKKRRSPSPKAISMHMVMKSRRSPKK